MSLSSHEGSRRQDLLGAALRQLQAADFPDPNWESQTLLARCLGLERLALLRDPEAQVAAPDAERFADWLQRYLAGEPLAYLEGTVGFYGREFQVDARVLVPRADSECVVEACFEIMAHTESGHMVDVGTGSGCLLWTILCERPQWRGLGIDASAAALQVAEANRQALGLQPRGALMHGSWLDPVRPGAGLDLVLSNPPYIVEGETLGPGVAEFEPHQALFTPGMDALEPYAILIQQATTRLKPGGHIVFEVGAGRAEAVAQKGQDFGFRLVGVRKDLGGVERAVILELQA